MTDPADRISDQLRVLTTRFLEPFTARGLGELTKQEARAVSAVARSGPLSMGALAEVLGVVQSRVTPLVDRLAAAGLVVRVRSESDRRVWLAEATEAGRTVAEDENEAYRALASGFLAPLTPQERAQFAGLLGRVVDALELDDLQSGRPDLAGTPAGRA